MATKSNKRRRWAMILGGVAVLAIAWYWRSGGQTEPEPFRTATIDRGDIRVVISATGSLSALSTVDVGTQVSGLVESVSVDFNDKVRKGQVIARIDPSTIRARVTQAEAGLASARAGAEQARANFLNAEADFKRKQDLVQKQLVSRSDFDLAKAAFEQAQAQVASASANIRQQQATLDSARVDLGHAEIVSPVDGVILARSVEPGQTVAASFQTPVLFKIAEDLAKMQIVLAVDEADIGQVQAGQSVGFTVDAFPDRRFQGKVEQVRLDATNTANVITYPVVVSVENADLSLLPGMTVNAEIEVSRRDGVLRVANAALRYKPADDVEVVEAKARNGMAGDLPAVAADLRLNPDQQAAFDAAMAALRERAAARAAASSQAGGNGGTSLFGRRPDRSSGGGGGGNDGAARQRMMERFGQQFSEFRATLTEAQRAQWDARLLALVGARRASLYLLQDGKAVQVNVRLGASDGSFTEVAGEVKEGDAAIVGSGRAAQ